MMVRVLTLALATASAMSLASCTFIQNDINKTLGRYQTPTEATASSLMQQGRNPFLWRASLDTLAFAPNVRADPATGAITTDWHVDPAVPNERMQVTVHVLHTQLRADALRVLAVREINQGGQWVQAPVAAATVQRLEEIILTRAQALHRAARI